MDPIVTSDETTVALRNSIKEGVKTIHPGITIHDFRAVVGRTHTNLIFDVVLPFESQLSPDEYNEALCNLVISERANHFCVITVDRG